MNKQTAEHFVIRSWCDLALFCIFTCWSCGSWWSIINICLLRLLTFLSIGCVSLISVSFHFCFNFRRTNIAENIGKLKW